MRALTIKVREGVTCRLGRAHSVGKGCIGTSRDVDEFLKKFHFCRNFDSGTNPPIWEMRIPIVRSVSETSNKSSKKKVICLLEKNHVSSWRKTKSS